MVTLRRKGGASGMFHVERISALLLMAATIAAAQSITSSIIGTIHDESGAVVPNAVITATNLATNARNEAKADPNGNFVLLQLTPGSYTVEVTAPGFRKYVRSGLVLELQQQPRIDATLTVGQVTEAVSVTADAAVLETTTSSIGDVVNNHAILNLPL